MSAINEIKQKGNAYRICIDDSDPTNLRWARESFWTAASDVEFEDGKTAEQKINEINAMIQEKFNQLFQSASDGKSLIASTLTGLGVNTSSDATYQTMSDNIKALATSMYNAGRLQGQKDVMDDPDAYGVETGAPAGSYFNVWLECYTNGMVEGATRGQLKFMLYKNPSGAYKLITYEETGMGHQVAEDWSVSIRPYRMIPYEGADNNEY